MSKRTSTPTVAQLEEELHRVSYLTRFHVMLRITISVLVIVAAAAVLVATLILPVLRIYGTSMTPTLADGDIIVSVKTESYQKGDILAFYFNNNILVKRVIAQPGEWVDIDAEGNVFVNGERLVEPYLTEKSLGECDIEFPYQVPDGRLFVLGDHRATSVDSRSTTVGCVSEEQIVGKLVFRVWPIGEIGLIR